MHRLRATTLVATCGLAAIACESPPDAAVAGAAATEAAATPGAAAPGEPAVTGTAALNARDFDLVAAAALVRDKAVKDGESFQRALNRSPRTRLDLDGDGERDPIQVVERRDGASRTLEVRVVPSTKREQEPDDVAVPVAVVAFAPDGDQARVIARYVDGVAGAGPPIHFFVPVVAGTLCHWVIVIERPIFIGVVVVIHHHHHHHKHKHHKHRKHRKHKRW